MYSSRALRFARALADVGFELGIEDEIKEQLIRFDALLEERPELREALENPALPLPIRRTIVRGVSDLLSLERSVANFILVLIDRGRIHQLDQVLEAYEEVMDERQGVLRGEVTSPRELDEKTRGTLADILTRSTSGQIRFRYLLDENLIGGLKVQIGSMVFDGSIRAQLEEIRKRVARGL